MGIWRDFLVVSFWMFCGSMIAGFMHGDWHTALISYLPMVAGSFGLAFLVYMKRPSGGEKDSGHGPGEIDLSKFHSGMKRIPYIPQPKGRTGI